ncbi:MAG: M48 family metallopeptidase [Candidatus Omnitrophica bacterium]|nr:M48 family metallopeptidase [Candidatus Omnitrophota bacterium]
MKDELLTKAKHYSLIKYSLIIFNEIYVLVLLFIFLVSGLSKRLSSQITEFTQGGIFAVALYLFITYVLYYLLDLPFNLYRSYLLEHRFSLSNQKIKDWMIEQLKAFLIFYIISLIFISAFYFILNHYRGYWWLVVSLCWIFFSLVLTKLTPLVIIPLFFKYQKLKDQTLRERIMRLAEKLKIKMLDCYEIDFSKKTLKANACFVGIGRTKRVILADTLKDRYSYDEIEVVLAHEFAHYKLRHLIKLLLVGSLTIIISFYIISISSKYLLKAVGLNSLSDLAALPLILIYLIIFEVITQPLQNYISRHLERKADILAIKITGLKEAFISMMEKLSVQNLADRKPHPLIKFFFFDHPPIEERIKLAKDL